MKICVLVKAVPDASRRVDPSTGRLDRSGEGGLNVGDRYAVEAGLQLREAEGGEVVAITVGPQGADRAMRRALAMGCDRGVQLCDPSLSGSDMVATGYALAQIVEREQPDLVLLGERSSDGGGGAIAAIVAAMLNWPVLAGARSLKLSPEGLLAEQITEFGRIQVAVHGRAVVSVGADANIPRYASLKETMEARARPLEIIGADALGLDPSLIGAEGAGVRGSAWRAPATREPGVVREPQSIDAAVELILEWLREKELL